MTEINTYEVIQKKRDAKSLSQKEIDWFIQNYTNSTIPDYQMASLLMAIFTRGMNTDETSYLTESMLYSGQTLDFPGTGIVDKHSTGGVGDKTSFIIAPIAAAAGVKVPMISGRGLGHTGGTLDKLDAIKKIKTNIPPKDFVKQVQKCNLAFAGQTQKIAPADKKIYALRNVTATVESIPLITASIMSKKLAEGIDGLVLDVKTGNGAFMPSKRDAKKLAMSLKNTALKFNTNVHIFLTDMSQPLGNAVGHSLELIESVEILKNKGPKDLIDLSVSLAGAMIHLGGKSSSFESGKSLARKLIKNGSALKKFAEVIKYQGGDPSFIKNYKLLPTAKFQHVIKAPESGWITKLDSKNIGLSCIKIGGGRKVKSDPIDYSVGYYFHKKVGAKVARGTPLVTIYHNEKTPPKIAYLEEQFINKIFTFSKKKPKPNGPLISMEKSYWSKK